MHKNRTRHSSAKKIANRQSQESTRQPFLTSSQSSNSHHYQDKYPDIFKRKKQKVVASHKSVRQKIKELKQQDDLSPSHNVKIYNEDNTHRRLPKIKIISDYSQFNSKNQFFRRPRQERCRSLQNNRLQQVEERKDEQQNKKEVIKAHKFVTDLNEFNNISKSTKNIVAFQTTESNNYEITDIQEVIQLQEPKRKDSERQIFRLKVDELDQPRKKFTIDENFEQIEEQQKEKVDEQKQLLLRKNLQQQNEFIKKIMKSQMVQKQDFYGYQKNGLDQIEVIKQAQESQNPTQSQ